ncbi:COQ9 family protein [Pseudooceanicola sediminis]|uniref:COQ9 family protein n=1 Tax=Pseudooceanicola sediminis TaxID=2211117 RepID=A0A399IWZ1_9RHOB|nr:COQ9 family protein [Pseudooceanicola sediminis]KAA2312936.1 COQ9 family protein [Puniceibacterium sp. HSS470]RII37663.1 COQ9 family protein [Pseudooceanicola sediminis]
MTDDTQFDAETDPDHPHGAADLLLDAALTHVPFDGWSEATLKAAAADAEVPMGLARALYPRGAIDLALAYHKRGDAEMVRRFAAEDHSGLRYSEKVARAIRIRLELADRELVRRGATLFALPQNASDGAKAVWGSADAVWRALGDTSDDVNWYTKRMTLSGVYSATVLYWLGDDSLGQQATWDFLDRRIAGVMQFEKAKARMSDSRLGQALAKGPMALLSRLRAPQRPNDMPGSFGQ